MPLSQKIAKLNVMLERLMPLLAPTGILLGIIFPAFFVKLRPFIPLLFGAMTLSGALKLKARDLVQVIKNPLPIITFFFTAHFLMPLAVMLISRLIFGNDTDTISGYVLIYSVPTAVSGFIWVSIYRGDPALCLALILLDTVLAPLVVPGTVALLLGSRVVLDMSGMATSLIMMIVIPTVIGVVLNETSRGAIPKIINPYLSPMSKILMLLVISANCAAVAPQIDLQNPRLLIIAAACIFFTALGFSIGKLTGLLGQRIGFFGENPKDKQVSLFFTSGLRNISAAMTLGIEFFPGPAALPAVLGIVFQQTMAALMGRIYMGKVPSAQDKE